MAFDFSKIGIYRGDCAECGEPFRASREDETLCTEHRYFRDHPEEAPQYWTWRKRGEEWWITAWLRERADLPQVGDVVVAHRKDGTRSRQQIIEVGEIRLDRIGRYITECRVVCGHAWQFAAQLPMSQIKWQCGQCGEVKIENVNDGLEALDDQSKLHV